MDILALAMARAEVDNLKKSGGVGYSDAEVILPSTKLELVNPDPESTIYAGIVESNAYELVAGQRYKVTWNGTDYDRTAFDFEGAVLVGNKVFYGLDDTGEPFSIVFRPGEVLVCYTFEPTATVSISTETVHTIEPKYLPKGSVGYSEETVIFPSTRLELVEEDGRYIWAPVNVPFKLIAGQYYKVIWNGAEYNLTGIGFNDVGTPGVMLAQPDEQFFIVYAAADGEEQLLCYTNEPTVTMSVIAETTRTIDKKYLGDGVLPVVEIADINAITDAESMALSVCVGNPIIIKSSDSSGSIACLFAYMYASGVHHYSGYCGNYLTIRSTDGATWTKV